MKPFERLHGAVQHHVVNSLGWRQLRPLQEQAIAPILAGHNALCIAPTAGGKTEAAILPLFSRMLEENWQGLGVIYVCPIKALLNNLEQRLQHYAGLFGRSVALWHGDVGAGDKRKTRQEPPDILLTTPESIEGLLISTRQQPELLFAKVKTVVVDELHAFAGADRGWQLLCLIERVAQLANTDIQRIGLSATVGNPEELLDWLAGSSRYPRSVVNSQSQDTPATDIKLDYVGSLDNAALVISRLHRGEKRLVFCDSRSQAESLAFALRGLGVTTYVSHSSLSVDARRQAERAFAEGSNCVIVATSTLELGIDVGDLDRVIQIDAPYSVASFLQRLGRSGRRLGTTRNCLFLATSRDSLLRAGALLTLWRQGYVEPVVPPPYPFAVMVQQIISLCLQFGQVARDDLADFFGTIPALAQTVNRQQVKTLLDFLIEAGFLVQEHGLVGIGPQAEATFGRYHYLDLLSVFETETAYRALHGRQEIGLVHSLALSDREDTKPVLTLAGRSWRVIYINERRRVLYLEPTEVKGRSRWFGLGQASRFELCQAMKAFILNDHPPEFLSNRGIERFEELQFEFAWLDADTSCVTGSDDRWVWWTFAGQNANTVLACHCRAEFDAVSFDVIRVRFRYAGPVTDLQESLRRVLAKALTAPHPGPMAGRDNKFDACVPNSLRFEQAAERLHDQPALRHLQDAGIKSITD